MCKKTLNENSEHIFVKCELAENFFDFIKNAYLDKKELQNSLVLLKFKRNVTEKDYVINECKHGMDVNPFETFKFLFNKWYISLTNI